MRAEKFIDRKTELDWLASAGAGLLTIHGETGVGKTRLLEECQRRWQEPGGACRVILVDLREACGGKSQKAEALLRAIIGQAPELFSGVWTSPEQAAGLVVSQLAARAQQCPEEQACVILIFDTAEELQNERDVWDWLEQNLVRPLVLARNIKVIFSGRTPIKWLDFEVRRHAGPPFRLEPLKWEEPGGPARELALALIEQGGEVFTGAAKQELVRVILDLSFGHPRLIEELVDFIHRRPDRLAMPDLYWQLSQEVVQKFIEEQIFKAIPGDWRYLLWWMSVLDYFDSILLKIYLNLAVPDAVRGQPEAYFLKGIRMLHERSLVIWKEGQGEQFQGVVGKIIRKCFSITRKEHYVAANKAAAEAYRALVKDYLVDEEELKRNYHAQADAYEQRAVTAEAA